LPDRNLTYVEKYRIYMRIGQKVAGKQKNENAPSFLLKLFFASDNAISLPESISVNCYRQRCASSMTYHFVFPGFYRLL
jgi:hypothetical protein